MCEPEEVDFRDFPPVLPRAFPTLVARHLSCQLILTDLASSESFGLAPHTTFQEQEEFKSLWGHSATG